MQTVNTGVRGAGRPDASIVPTHRPGRHCGSSAIRDLLEFHGLTLTEAFCFGLGAGLGITYVELPDSDTPFMVHVRSMGFEEKVFATLAVPFHWESWQDPSEAAEVLDRYLDQGRPALLLTDIYHLPYFKSSTHFPGHAIVAWRRGDDGDSIMVSDTERPDLLPVPRDELAKARFSPAPPFVHHGSLFAPSAVFAELSPDRVLEAIVFNARALKQGSRTRGIAALRTWVKDLPRWQAFNKWPWLLRFAYQVIEKRGTGGGGFRVMYAEFLDEAQAMLPEIGTAGLPRLMRECANAWSALAECLRRGSEGKQFPVDPIARAIDSVRVAELRYVDAALTMQK